jgi:hypothetical protein
MKKERTCSHPEFAQYFAGGACPHVFVFERRRFRPLEADALAEYQKNREIVEAHGGHMDVREWEAGGQNPKFTAEEVALMVEAVAEENPDLVFNSTWNGEGCYTLSVGMFDGIAVSSGNDPEKSEVKTDGGVANKKEKGKPA